MAYYRILDIVPCAVYSMTLLCIHSTFNSLHLLIPHSQSIPPLCLPLGNLKSVLYVDESISVL